MMVWPRIRWYAASLSSRVYGARCAEMGSPPRARTAHPACSARTPAPSAANRAETRTPRRRGSTENRRPTGRGYTEVTFLATINVRDFYSVTLLFFRQIRGSTLLLGKKMAVASDPVDTGFYSPSFRDGVGWCSKLDTKVSVLNISSHYELYTTEWRTSESHIKESKFKRVAADFSFWRSHNSGGKESLKTNHLNTGAGIRYVSSFIHLLTTYAHHRPQARK